MENESNLIILQRVIRVIPQRYYHQTPFSIDFAVIQESEDEMSFLFDSFGLSLQTQMRIRLFTGFELSEILQDRCRNDGLLYNRQSLPPAI